MRYNRFRDYLSRSARDMRNPYGSRGGYVVSDRRGRDYEANGGRQYSGTNADRHYPMYDYSQNGDYNQSNRQFGRDYEYDMTYPVRRSGYFDYNTYGDDYAMRRDYGSDEYKLTPTEIRKWEKELRKNGGTAFDINQVRQIAQQQGIRFDEFTPELLTAIANMLYSDYKDTIKGDVLTYVKLAENFLCDDDFDGTPEEKAYLYYNAIVNKDDD